jgi:hypothetical protein
MPTIIYTEPLNGKCPVQAEGTIDGYPFYFRSRGGHWALKIAEPGRDPECEARWTYREEYKGRHAARDVEINDGRKFAAGWADEDECAAFIERCADAFSASQQPNP